MEKVEGEKPRLHRSFTPEFKPEIVELCRRSDRSIGQVAREFDLTETNVRTWLNSLCFRPCLKGGETNVR